MLNYTCICSVLAAILDFWSKQKIFNFCINLSLETFQPSFILIGSVILFKHFSQIIVFKTCIFMYSSGDNANYAFIIQWSFVCNLWEDIWDFHWVLLKISCSGGFQIIQWFQRYLKLYSIWHYGIFCLAVVVILDFWSIQLY